MNCEGHTPSSFGVKPGGTCSNYCVLIW